MQLVFAPSTHADLLWMRRYYARVFPDGAKRAAEQYFRVLGVLRENPLIGHPVEEMPGVREFPVPRTSFSFIYRVVGDQIEVLRVWDQRGDRSGFG